MFCLLCGWVTSFVGLIVVAYGLFTDVIVHGPTFGVSDSAVGSKSPGIATFTPTELTDTGLRIGWNAASSLILFGIAVAFFALARVLRDLDAQPLFSADATRSIVFGSVGAGLLIGLGGLVRWILEGRIGDAVGIESSSAYNGPRFNEWLWVLDIPLLAMAVTVMAIGGAWARARSLQSDVEGVV